MDALKIIDDYISTINKHKVIYKNILMRTYECNNDFIELDVTGMISLLIDDLKINKVSVAKNFYHTLSMFFRYLNQQGIVEENLFDFISYEQIKKLTYKNLCILTENDINKLIDSLYNQNSNNAPYEEVVIRLCYECISDSISEILKIKRSNVLLQDKSINGIDISDKLIDAILKMYSMDSWLYKESRRDLYSPLENIDNKRLFSYAIRGKAPAETVEKREDTAHLFIQRNIFSGLEFNGYSIDPQILYCCGLTNKIIKDFGMDYFNTMFSKTRLDGKKYYLKDENYSFKRLKEKYKIKCELDTLKEKMMPYSIALKNKK